MPVWVTIAFWFLLRVECICVCAVRSGLKLKRLDGDFRVEVLVASPRGTYGFVAAAQSHTAAAPVTKRIDAWICMVPKLSVLMLHLLNRL